MQKTRFLGWVIRIALHKSVRRNSQSRKYRLNIDVYLFLKFKRKFLWEWQCFAAGFKGNYLFWHICPIQMFNQQTNHTPSVFLFKIWTIDNFNYWEKHLGMSNPPWNSLFCLPCPKRVYHMYNDFNYFKNFVNKGIFPKRMFLEEKKVLLTKD